MDIVLGAKNTIYKRAIFENVFCILNYLYPQLTFALPPTTLLIPESFDNVLAFYFLSAN